MMGSIDFWNPFLWLEKPHHWGALGPIPGKLLAFEAVCNPWGFGEHVTGVVPLAMKEAPWSIVTKIINPISPETWASCQANVAYCILLPFMSTLLPSEHKNTSSQLGHNPSWRTRCCIGVHDLLHIAATLFATLPDFFKQASEWVQCRSFIGSMLFEDHHWLLGFNLEPFPTRIYHRIFQVIEMWSA